MLVRLTDLGKVPIQRRSWHEFINLRRRRRFSPLRRLALSEVNIYKSDSDLHYADY